MQIKKQFTELITLLESNQEKMIKTILPQVLALCESKVATLNCLFDKNKRAFAIYCYFHKQWEIVLEVDYSAVSKSPSGKSRLCKLGQKAFTAQQNAFKLVPSKVLELVESGKIKTSEIKETTSKLLQDTKTLIEETHQHDTNLYNTLEQVEAKLLEFNNTIPRIVEDTDKTA